MILWKKQFLIRAIRIQKENWSNQAFFRDELKFGKKMPYILCILKLF